MMKFDDNMFRAHCRYSPPHMSLVEAISLQWWNLVTDDPMFLSNKLKQTL